MTFIETDRLLLRNVAAKDAKMGFEIVETVYEYYLEW